MRNVRTLRGMTGLELKLRRVAARVKQQDIAAVMGVTKSRVSGIEREHYPSAEATRRYLAALETLTDVPHVAVAS